jgi:hypothetical protein
MILVDLQSEKLGAPHFRNLAISALRLAGRANIAHARRDLHDHNDAFAALGI